MKNEAKRIAVSGAGGFLGTQLLKALSAEDFEVFALTSQTERCEEQFSGANFHFFKRDRFDEIRWDKIDVLINCAFPCNTNGNGRLMADGLDYVERLLTLAVNRGVKALINVSSQSVYSQKRQSAADESEPINVETSYAVGKYAAELLVEGICGDIPYTNLRMANLVGAASKQRIVNRFVQQIIEGKEIHITNANRHFDYLDVRDAADAILRVSKSEPEAWETVYNIGSGMVYSIIDFAHIANAVAQRRGIAPVNVIFGEQAASGEWGNTALCNERFCRQFGWKPEYSLEDTIDTIFDCVKANWGG